MKQLFFFLFACCILANIQGAEPKDLDTLKRDFVLETRRIQIPEFEHAFNPCIVSWKGRLLMSFRSYDKVTQSTDAIYLVYLDEEFKPISKPVCLERNGEYPLQISKAQDPRLIVVEGKLHIIYSNLYPFEEPVGRMIVATLEEDEAGGFSTSSATYLIDYYGQIERRKEKNWVPFVYNNQLLLSYSLQPHRIFAPIGKTGSCASIGSSISTLAWDWGNLLGGTPALRVGNSYLAFFHSNKAMSTVQSGGKIMNHYFMGAYTFEADYPFSLTGISPRPIVGKTFYQGEMYENLTWKPLRVVFPMGFIVDKNFIWLTYGRQDHEAWIVKLDKAKLFASLVPLKMVTHSVP